MHCASIGKVTMSGGTYDAEADEHRTFGLQQVTAGGRTTRAITPIILVMSGAVPALGWELSRG